MINKNYTTENQIGVPTDEDIALINTYSLKQLNKDEIFCFSVILCDNDIDRDFERFNKESLRTLESLFVGKTGILNHSMKSEDQSCRTYKTQFMVDSDKKTVDGQPYMYLKAWCYTVKSEKNQSLIKDIESGIKKEVSISCAADSRICSVCGESHCNHIAGRKYNGEICHKTITDITDAYEWSFVAVPAQRNAGVTKAFTPGKESAMNPSEIIKSMTEDSAISDERAKALSDYIENLEALAKQAQCYKEHLTKDVARFARIIMPQVNTKQFTENCANMDLDSLKKLRDDMQKQASEVLPITSQIKASATHKSHNNNDFII
jgi:hypothetical protein